MIILAVGGYAYAGKDAFVDALEEMCGYKRTFMSKPLMNALLTLNPLIPLTISTNRFAMGTHTRYSALHEYAGYSESKKEPEVRRLLQILGTEVGRVMFGDDVWIDLILEELDSDPDSSWAVTGVRYHNEIAGLKACGGTSVWIHRPGVTAVNAHSSDNTLKPEDFDYQVHNDGTLEDLSIKAHDLQHRLNPPSPYANSGPYHDVTTPTPNIVID